MKILIMLCYFALLAPVIVAGNTVIAVNSDKLVTAFANYFACEATGTNPKCDDMKKALEPLTAVGPLISIHLLMGCFPVVLLLYAVNFEQYSRSVPHFGHLCFQRSQLVLKL